MRPLRSVKRSLQTSTSNNVVTNSRHNRIYMQIFPLSEQLVNTWETASSPRDQRRVLAEFGFDPNVSLKRSLVTWEMLASIVYANKDEKGLVVATVSRKAALSFPSWLELKDSISAGTSSLLQLIM